MQEEVENRTINLAISTTRLTARSNQHEISATIAQLTSRIQKIAKARDGLVNRTGKDD